MRVNMESVKSIRSWEAADDYFNKTNQPRSKYWHANERPLRDTAAHHLRIERRSDESYDLVLYRHTMVRYHKPDAKGNHVVDLFVPWAGSTNYSFLWNAGWGHAQQHYALRYRGKVWLQLYPSSENDGHSAHLVLDKEDRIRTSESWQLQAFRWRYSKDRAEWRGTVKDKMQDIVNLLTMVNDSYIPEYNQDFTDAWRASKWWNRNKKTTAAQQLGGSRVRDELADFVLGERAEFSENASAGLVAWFKRVLDVRFTKAKDNGGREWKLDRAGVEAYVVRLLENEHNVAMKVKVPVKMWRCGGNKPSRHQFFHTRGEAERAQREALDLPA